MKKSRLGGTSQWGGGEAESIHGKAKERIAKVCHKIQRTSSDNNGKEPSRADAQPLCEGKITRPRQAHYEHHQRNQQDPQDTRKCCQGMMTMLQAFKAHSELSKQSDRSLATLFYLLRIVVDIV